jgi:hypothetical protein
MAQRISILGEDTELDELRGERVADRLEDDPRFQRVAADPERGVEAENGSGSFEAFFSMFGGGGAPPPGGD